MPYERPGAGYYPAAATKTVNHNDPVVEDGIVGVAVKQKAPNPETGLTNIQQIAIGEAFHIRTKGIKQVPVQSITSPAKGDAVYIIAATNQLTKTATSNVKYGRIVELAGQRGTPTGYVRVDLDAKDSF
jgi:predicted RecA/RadA family phage recombinase